MATGNTTPHSNMMAYCRPTIVGRFNGIALAGSLPSAFLHAQPRGGLRVFRLEPGFHFAASVRRVDALRHDAFEAELAGVLENVSAVAAHVFAVADAGLGFAQQLGERGLAIGERLAAHVVPSSASRSNA